MHWQVPEPLLCTSPWWIISVSPKKRLCSTTNLVPKAYLEAISVQELGVVGGVGVVEAEGRDRVSGVIALREHAEVCQGGEEAGHICDCAPDRPSNITIQHQRNDAGPEMQHRLLIDCRLGEDRGHS